MSEAWIIDAVRTPRGIGKVGKGALAEIHPQRLGATVLKALAERNDIKTHEVDDIIWGTSSQRGKQGGDLGRMSALDAGYDVPVYHEDGTLALDHEEFPRPQTTREGLAGLKPAFEAMAEFPIDDQGTTLAGLIRKVYPDLKIKHVHHAGNSSGVVDGSAALLLASPDYAKKQGWKPRARVVAVANVGDSPTLMLNAPVPAARKVLEKAGLTIDDIDLFEINEAFAVVAEKFIRDLKLDRDKVNVNGGAMALGHPIGATGSILIGTMLDELERRDLKRGLITMCAAGGMAPAIIIERI